MDRCSETTTNCSFKGWLKGWPVFVRLGHSQAEQLGIDRQREIAHHSWAASLGLAPRIIAHQVYRGILVTEYLEAAPISPSRLHERGFLERWVALLQRLHASLNATNLETTQLQRNELLSEQLWQHGGGEWLALQRQFEPGYYDGVALGLCHGDLFRGNCLEDAEGRLWLVDWEYAYIGPVIDDVGKLCAANWLSEEEIEWVVIAYFGAAKSFLLHKVWQNIFAQQLGLYLWCQIRMRQEKTDPAPYLALAEEVTDHLERLRVQLK